MGPYFTYLDIIFYIKLRVAISELKKSLSGQIHYLSGRKEGSVLKKSFSEILELVKKLNFELHGLNCGRRRMRF